MNSNSFERLLVRAILILSGFVLFVPLFIFSQSYFPFIVVKASLMRVLIELIVLLYVILWLNNRQKWQPRFSWVGGIIGIYILIMIVSAIFGASPARSFWSNWERMSGVFTFIHYGLWFMVLTSVLKEVRQWQWLAWTTLLVSLLMSIYAWLQYLNVDWSFVFMGGSSRLSGTLGNAAYFGSYMTMHAFIAGLLFFSYKDWRRWFLAVYVLYSVLMVLLSGTRGAFLGLIASGMVLLFLIPVLRLWQNKFYRWLGVVGLVLIVLGGLTVLFRNSQLLKENYLVKRFASISIQDNTAQTRLRSWQYGLMGFKENWWLGFGPENFHVPFNKYFKADFYDYTGNEIWFDYAHSMLVETASTMGLGGFLVYIALHLSVIYVAIKKIKQNRDNIRLHQSLLMVMAITAIFVQNAFVFDSFNTYIIFFFIIAWATFWQVEGVEVSKIINKNIAIPVALILIIFCCYGLMVNAKAVTASDLVFKGYGLMSQAKYDDALMLFDRSKSLTYNIADPMILYSQALGEKISTIKTQADALKLDQQFKNAEPLMIKAMNSDSQSVSLRLTLVRFYLAWAQLTQNVEYVKKAEENVLIAIQFSPERLHALWSLAQIKMIQGDYQEADKILEDAIKLNPKQGQSYWFKFYIASYTNKNDQAMEYLWLAVANGFQIQSLPILEQAIDYAVKNNFTSANQELRQAIKQAIALGTNKQFILDLYKQLPVE